MKAKNVELGLRVQMKSKVTSVPVGALDIITRIDGDVVWVYWDDNVGGWGDGDYGIPSGHGWAVISSDIRKFKGESK